MSKWKLNGLLALASIFVTLLILEIILRLMGFGNVETYLPDQNLIWRLKPRQETYTKYGLKPVSINSAGLRDREYSKEKSSNTYRVLVLGNSCTYGWGVGQEDTYPKVLERKLASVSNQNNFEIINGGVIGYSIAQELEYLKKDGLSWNPDLVVISHTFNEGKRVNPTSPQELKDKVFFSLRLKNFLRNIAIYHYIVEHNFSHQYVQLSRRITEDPSWIDESAFDLYVKNLQEIIDICSNNKIQVAFLITVSKNQVLNDDIKYSKHQNAMIDAATKNKILLINPMTALRENKSKELFVDGGHPTELGHKLIAEEIYKTVFDTSKIERTH